MKHELYQLAFAPTLDAADADRPRQFSGIAYSGGLIPKYGWLGDVAIDLSTLTAPSKEVFALVNHDADQRAGRVTITNTGSTIEVLGTFLNHSPYGRQVAEEFSEGAPWEFSVGLTAEIEEFKTPTLVNVNGQALRLNALLKHASVREVSFVPAGADPNTQAIAFAQPDLFSMESPMDDELNQMKAQLASVSTLNADLQVQLSAQKVEYELIVADLNQKLLAEVEQSKAMFDRANQLEIELQAFKADIRLNAIKVLFSDLHREWDESSAQVYASLSDEAFVAIANDLRTLKAPNFASSLFQEVAVKTQAESKSEHDFATQLFAQVAGSK